jgi:hypothetical protein
MYSHPHIAAIGLRNAFGSAFRFCGFPLLAFRQFLQQYFTGLPYKLNNCIKHIIFSIPFPDEFLLRSSAFRPRSGRSRPRSNCSRPRSSGSRLRSEGLILRSGGSGPRSSGSRPGSEASRPKVMSLTLGIKLPDLVIYKILIHSFIAQTFSTIKKNLIL